MEKHCGLTMWLSMIPAKNEVTIMMCESESSELGPLEEGPDGPSPVVVEDEACARRPKSTDLRAGATNLDWPQVHVHATVPLCPPCSSTSRPHVTDISCRGSDYRMTFSQDSDNQTSYA